MNIEDVLLKAAQRDAQKQGGTLSEIINQWARIGHDMLNRKKIMRRFHPADLGGPARIDLSSRRNGMDYFDLHTEPSGLT